MKKSKYIFLIICFAYLVIAVGGALSLLCINSSVLFGLSAASLCISLGDAISNIIMVLKLDNSYNYALKFTSDFLDSMIKQNCLSVKNIDICNVKLNIDLLNTIKKPEHPINYDRKKQLYWGNVISNLFFFVGILLFVVTPFVINDIDIKNVSSYLTIIAFAIACANVYLTDCANEITQKNTDFSNDKMCMLELMFPGFIPYLTNEMTHKSSVEQNRQFYESTLQANNSQDESERFQKSEIGG